MSHDVGQPITPEEIEGLFASLLAFRHVLLAVSGGADSTALMLLAAQWRSSRAEGPRLSVATVDHGLRPGSAEEAIRVSDWARSLGLPHVTLPWVGVKPRTRIQETARGARYRLLVEHAEQIGAEALATGHHADDQAETVLMRLIRGSGPAGLAGMAAISMKGSIVHLRPLLAVEKTRLVATLSAAGHPWIEDPSNRSEAYGRNRLRRIMQALEPEGLSRARLTMMASRMARAEEALSAAASEAFRALVATSGEGSTIQPALWDQPSEIRLRVLVATIQSVSGGEKSERLDRAEQACRRLEGAFLRGEPVRATLGGCLVFLDSAGHVAVTREGARRRGSFRQA